MAKIHFSNGATVDFNGNPTEQDIHAVAHQLGIVDTPPNTQNVPSIPRTRIGNAGQTIQLDKTPSQKIAAIPSQLLDAGKTLFGLGGAGADIAGAIGGNRAANQQKKLAEQDAQYVSTILSLRKKAQQEGKDTSHWDNLIKNYHPITDPNQSLQEIYPALGKSSEQVVGDFAQIAASIIAAGTPQTALRAAQPVAGAVRGAVAGAKVGAATGALAGGAQGFASGLQANRSAGGVALETAGGAIVGGAAGGAIGGIAGGIQGNKLAQASREENFALNLTSPRLSAKQKAQAIASGNYNNPGVFKPASLEPTAHDRLVAQSVEGIVSPKATVAENVSAIDGRISDINAGVRALIQDKKVPFNTAQLRTKLLDGKQDLQLVFASDATAEKTYNAAVNSFLDYVKGKDTLGLFEARQAWDKTPAVQKLLGSSALGENTKKEVVLAVRRAANDYIASLLPKGNPYRAALIRESRMIEALGNIGANNAATIGMNKIQIFTKKYPILKWLVGGAATGIVGAAGVGVGGAVINSTE